MAGTIAAAAVFAATAATAHPSLAATTAGGPSVLLVTWSGDTGIQVSYTAPANRRGRAALLSAAVAVTRDALAALAPHSSG